MKHRAGQHHAPKAKHTLFALLRPDALRDDDNREFLDMLNRSQRTIFQICLHFTDRSPDAIRDLYQEIACNLWEAWPRFRGDSNTDTWVRRIALNVAVTEIRRHAKQPRFVPLEDWMYDTISEEIDKAPPDYFRPRPRRTRTPLLPARTPLHPRHRRNPIHHRSSRQATPLPPPPTHRHPQTTI